MLDPETAQRLGATFNAVFDDLAAPDGLFADDAFFDMLPPFWRFQLEGPKAFVAQLQAIVEGETSTRLIRVVPTATGFVLEHEMTSRGVKTEVARRLWLCEVRDGRITEATCYCNGGWDDELRARHALEAPMLRP
jgi:ketosteroid isomerase-like protein